MKQLRDKVVVITGAGSGIGRATARAFAREGARLHLVDIDPASLAAAAAEIEQLEPTPVPVVTHVIDCSDGTAVEALAAEVFASEGRVDVLHNNAGVCCGGPVQDLSLEDWTWTVNVNLWGVIHGIRAFIPRMIQQGGGGHVVNTASMAGLVGLPLVAPYCATKFAVVGLSESLGVELAAHDIYVTIVCPGAVRTNVMRSARLRLPGRWQGWISEAFDRQSADPDALARDIVKAVRSNRSWLLRPGHMLPLWWLKRLSLSVYQVSARALTTRAVRWRGARS